MLDTRKMLHFVKESARERKPGSNGVAQSVPESLFWLTVSCAYELRLPLQRLSQSEPRPRLPVRV